MAGSSPREAVEAFISPLRRSVLCVTQQVPLHLGGYHVGAQHMLSVGDPEPIRLRGTDMRLSLTLFYRIVETEGERGPFKVSIAAYYYTVHDAEGRDILAYHWHPERGVATPHLHVGPGARAERAELAKAHLPTGRVSVEAVIRLLIEAFHAKPLRQTWAEDLAAGEVAFESWRMWG